MMFKLNGPTLTQLVAVRADLFRHRKELAITSLMTMLAWSFFLVHFLLNNHGERFPYVRITEQLFAGRWFSPVFFFLAGGANTPVFAPLFGIILLLLCAIIVAEVWKVRLVGLPYVLFLSLITTFPAFTATFYYNYAAFMFPASMLLAALAMRVASRLSLAAVFGGSLLVMFAMATNQPAFSTACVIFVGSCIVTLTDSSKEPGYLMRQLLQEAIPKAISIVAGALMYKLSLPLLGIGDSHATQALSVGHMIERVPEVVLASFQHLLTTQPEFSETMRWVLLAVIALGFLSTAASVLQSRLPAIDKIVRIGLMSVFWFALIVASKAMYIVSPTSAFYEYRYNLAMALLYALPFSFLLARVRTKPVRFLSILLAAAIVVRFVQVDLLRQGVLYRGQLHDLAIANRILYRIESLPEIDPEKEYVLVKVGDYPRFRQKAFRSMGRKFDAVGSIHMDMGTINSNFAAGSAFQVLGTAIPLRYARYNPNFVADTRLAKQIIERDQRKPWPHDSSVFIHEHMVVIYFRN